MRAGDIRVQWIYGGSNLDTLTKNINEWLTSNRNVEVIDIKPAITHMSSYALIIYKAT